MPTTPSARPLLLRVWQAIDGGVLRLPVPDTGKCLHAVAGGDEHFSSQRSRLWRVAAATATPSSTFLRYAGASCDPTSVAHKSGYDHGGCLRARMSDPGAACGDRPARHAAGRVLSKPPRLGGNGACRAGIASIRTRKERQARRGEAERVARPGTARTRHQRRRGGEMSRRDRHEPKFGTAAMPGKPQAFRWPSSGARRTSWSPDP